jgi:3-polyprenyl-4-hydroxybenzoate decarboxylase
MGDSGNSAYAVGFSGGSGTAYGMRLVSEGEEVAPP